MQKSFYVLAVLALLWNIMGDAAYLMQVTMDLDALARTDPYQARLFAEMPVWVWSAYAVAVWVGTCAAVCLLLRRAIAVFLYAVSLAAVLIQFGYSFGATDLLAVKGVSAAIFPAVIILLTAAQMAYAQHLKKRSWLK
ncbi:sugar transporter [Sphingobium algorifonticola]|uniref:Sugar transporter n=1 Tax=Sphingobium algorifonticola TaxID=2008318 RepID=A0A437J5D5_9SPHN|nr:sugar transporter [Sphingobium algorifonticola]RVT40116.1 sugar transporter [Sphingobium algorifonticola]